MTSLEGKILGIIGGMGPLASMVFYAKIIEKTPADVDQDHIDMILLNHASMPDRTQSIEEGTLDVVEEKIKKDAKYLEESGAAAVVMTCNTAHVLREELKKSLSIPFIDMIEITVEELGETMEKGSTIGLLGTDGTLKAGVYQKALEEKGFVVKLPSKDIQEKVMSIIYDGIKGGNPIKQETFSAIDEEMRKDCQRVVLACTELSVYKEKENLPEFYLDALDVLTTKAIQFCKS